MPVVASIVGRSIRDSRGQSAVEVTVTDSDGRIATASVPSGSSLGKYEAVSLDADQAVQAINTAVAPQLLRTSLDSQKVIDDKLAALDTTPNHAQLGVNATLGISLACARLLAQAKNQPLYQYIHDISKSPGYTLPTPLFNVINGGKHANNNLDFQEYMVIPVSMKSFHEKLAAGRKIFNELGKLLEQHGHAVEIGAEGGYAPNLSTNEEGLGYLVQSIQNAGFTPGYDVWLGIDVAASALPPTFAPTSESYVSLYEDFPLLFLEDPFDEDEWEKWTDLKAKLAARSDAYHPYLLVGDDLFVGNSERLEQGIQKNAANAVLIKINQVGTLTELLECIAIAREHSYVHILSHRSGETLDSFVSDVAVGTAAAFIKAGAPNEQAPERSIKYDRVSEIEEEITMVGPADVA